MMVQQFILDEDDLKLLLADHFDTIDRDVDIKYIERPVGYGLNEGTAIGLKIFITKEIETSSKKTLDFD